jgi:hypothetical protein
MITVRHLNWWLAQVMEAFYAARDQWSAAVEAEGWETERRTYAETTPPPRLRDYLVAYRYKDGATA